MELTDFSAGLWLPGEADPTTQQATFAIPKNALLKADNVEYLDSGGIRGRRGRLSLASMPGPVVGLWRHYPRLGIGQVGPIIGAFYDNDPSVGTVDWNNPVGAGTVGGSGATANIPAHAATHYLSVLGGFALHPIPGGATVRGVTVFVTRIGSNGIIDNSVRLFFNGLPAGNEKATGDVWGLVPFTQVYGGPGDLWGLTLTPTDVNRGDFGVGFSVRNEDFEEAEARVIYVTMTVTYENGGNVFIASALTGFSIEHRIFDEGSQSFIPAVGGVPGLLPTSRPRYTMLATRGLTLIFDGTNEPLQFQGSIFQPIPQTGELAPRKGPYATVHKFRVFATDPDDDTAVYASAPNDHTNWPADAGVSLNDPYGGRVIGLVSLGDPIVFLKGASLWTLLGDIQLGPQLTQYSDVGCDAADTIQLTPWGIVFKSTRGLYLTDGQSRDPLELSGAVRSLFVDRNGPIAHPNAVGIYHRRSNSYLLRLSQDADEAWRVQRLISASGTVYAWSRFPAWQFNAAVAWNGDSDTGQLFVGQMDGNVLEVDKGSTDDGEIIPVGMQSAFLRFDRIGSEGRINQVYAEYRGKAALGGSLRYDDHRTDDVVFEIGATKAVAEMQRARTSLWTFSNMGRVASILLSDEAVGGPDFELHSVLWTDLERGAISWPTT
jgi:hypothetical protein